MVAVASLAARVSPGTARNNDVYLEANQLDRKRALAIAVSLTRSPLNDNVLSLDVAEVAQTLSE